MDFILRILGGFLGFTLFVFLFERNMLSEDLPKTLLAIVMLSVLVNCSGELLSLIFKI